jgi:hypothetical protein
MIITPSPSPILRVWAGIFFFFFFFFKYPPPNQPYHKNSTQPNHRCFARIHAAASKDGRVRSVLIAGNGAEGPGGAPLPATPLTGNVYVTFDKMEAAIRARTCTEFAEVLAEARARYTRQVQRFGGDARRAARALGPAPGAEPEFCSLPASRSSLCPAYEDARVCAGSPTCSRIHALRASQHIIDAVRMRAAGPGGGVGVAAGGGAGGGSGSGSGGRRRGVVPPQSIAADGGAGLVAAAPGASPGSVRGGAGGSGGLGLGVGFGASLGIGAGVGGGGGTALSSLTAALPDVAPLTMAELAAFAKHARETPHMDYCRLTRAGPGVDLDSLRAHSHSLQLAHAPLCRGSANGAAAAACTAATQCTACGGGPGPRTWLAAHLPSHHQQQPRTAMPQLAWLFCEMARLSIESPVPVSLSTAYMVFHDKLEKAHWFLYQYVHVFGFFFCEFFL